MTMARAAARYAKAYVDVLQTGKALEEHRQFLDFCTLAQDDRGLHSFLNHVGVSPAEKVRVLEAIAKAMGFGETTVRFLTLLAQNRRLSLLAALGEAVVHQVDKARGIEPVTLTTASALSEAELTGFKENMSAKLGRQVRVTAKVAPEILGGAIARVGSLIYDGSLQGQLARLRRDLAKEIS